MRNFQDTFETGKRSFINAFSICMTVPLSAILFSLEITYLWEFKKLAIMHFECEIKCSFRFLDFFGFNKV